MTRNLKYIKYKSGVSSNKKDIIGILNEDCWEDLEHYVREHELDWDEAIDVIKKYVNSRTKIENFDEFLSSHGLKNLTIGRHLLSDEIKELFGNNNCTFILKETIINNNGAISIDSLVNEPEGNIFNNFCAGWEDVARECCCLKPEKSAAVGSGEVFLNLLIQGASSGHEGDLMINGTYPLEVKAITSRKNYYKSGPHAVGQKGYIKLAWELYAYMNTYMFGKGAITDEAAAKLAYFQNNNGLQKFNNTLIKECLQKYAAVDFDDIIRTVADTFVDAIFYQYGYIPGNRCINRFEKFDKPALGESVKVLNNIQMTTLSGEYIIRENVNKIFRSNINQVTGFDNFSVILDVLGAVQLYLHSQIEKFEYIIFLCLDENPTIITEKNGKYLFISGCGSDGDDNPLTDIEYVISKLSFKPLDMPMNNQSRSGKIQFK